MTGEEVGRLARTAATDALRSVQAAVHGSSQSELRTAARAIARRSHVRPRGDIARAGAAIALLLAGESTATAGSVDDAAPRADIADHALAAADAALVGLTEATAGVAAARLYDGWLSLRRSMTSHAGEDDDTSLRVWEQRVALDTLLLLYYRRRHEAS